MNKFLELEKANKEVQDLSARIESVKFHLNNLKENLALLKSIRIQFQQNVEVLKDSNTIPSMFEYKKVVEELRTVNNRIYMMQIDFNNHNVILGRSEKMLLEAQERYAILWENQNAKVIRGEFGKK